MKCNEVFAALIFLKLFSFVTIFGEKEIVKKMHCKKTNTENSKHIFPEKELCGHCSPSFPIHMSVSDLYIPTIDLPNLLQENRWTDPVNI
jgi:hypothetical protein